MAAVVWHDAQEVLAPQDELVNVITEGGDTRQLIRQGGLWLLPDRSMYVYFGVKSWSRIPGDSEPSLEEIRERANRSLRIYRQWLDSPHAGTTTNEDLMASVIEDFLKLTDSTEGAQQLS